MIRLASGGETCWFLGDLVHLEDEVEHIDWAWSHADQSVLRATREKWYPDFSQHETLLFFGHRLDNPWGRIVNTARGYRWHSV